MKKARIALASPKITLCDTEKNADLIIGAIKEACGNGAEIIAFPELVITGASCADLYKQRSLLSGASRALAKVLKATKTHDALALVGLPILHGESIYNAVAAISGGEILAITVGGGKYFSKAPSERIEVTVAGQKVTAGADFLFTNDTTGVNMFVEIGGIAPISDIAKEREANLVLNLTAMQEYLGLGEIRQTAAVNAAKSLGAVYAVCSAGEGESTTDGIYAGARLIAKGNKIVKEAPLFSEEILYADVTVGNDRVCKPSPAIKTALTKTPFVPEDKEKLESWCSLALEIQSHALAARLTRSHSEKCIIGVSGGLDSTLALLVCARAMDMLGRERKRVVAITMPCYGTTQRTKSNALALSDMLGCDGREIDIKAAVTQHFKDISHDESCYNVVYENAQARERTQILMDIANAEGGIVVGTGDLSELALGFATYNGDQMSMYGVNASVPKTLMREIIRYEAKRLSDISDGALSKVLIDVIETPVSPELLPTDGKEVTQQTEDIVGPYVLHDFFLYHTVKYGRAPKEILKLCKKAFLGEYSEEYIKKYLAIFERRFFTQQFKRSAMPDGPLVTEISLSPRGAFNMPSDAASNILRKI